MTGEEMERAIEFLASHHAKFSVDIDRPKETQAKTSDNLQLLTGKVLELAEADAATQSKLDSVIEEMREGFNNLIIANEVTRKLSEDAARPALNASHVLHDSRLRRINGS